MYVALFNIDNDGAAVMSVGMAQLGLQGKTCAVREVWTNTSHGTTTTSTRFLNATVQSHGVALLELDKCSNRAS